MHIRLEPSFLDIHERSAKLTEMGDPLVGLNERMVGFARAKVKIGMINLVYNMKRLG